MHSEDVAIFWDYENCAVASHFTGYEIVKKIRNVAHNFGTIKLFKAYLELLDPATFSKSLVLRSELQSSGVSLTDCPHNGRKDVADKMMLVDMLAYAIDNSAPATIILISGDRDFAYAVSILRHRRYRVVIISPQSIHTSLKVQASVFLDWNTSVLGAEVADDCLPPSTGRPPRLEAHQPPTSPALDRSNFPPFLQRGSRFNANPDVDINQYLHSKAHDTHSFGSVTASATREVPVASAKPYSRTPLSCRNFEDEDTDPVPVLVSPSKTQSLPAADDLSPSPTVVNTHFSAVQTTDGPGMKPSRVLKDAPPVPPAALTSPLSGIQNLTPAPYLTPIIRDAPLTHPATPPEHPTVTPPNKATAHQSLSVPLTAKSTPLAKAPYVAPDGALPTNVALESKVVPPIFNLLVQRLDFYRSKGFPRPLRSGIAAELSTQDNTLYKRAGVDKFKKYVAMAEKAGIVELGGKDGDDWIALCPEWHNAKTA